MTKAEKPGVIFNIQHYSVHDGPGIRTTVFLKGCPLGCLWCQNPESQVLAPQLLWDAARCSGCGRCVTNCPEKAITLDQKKAVPDRKKCQGCGQCTAACPNEARTLLGKYASAAEVFQEINDDVIFYETSGGGMTLSGGEPLAQPDFCLDILKLCRQAGIHTAVETSGFATWESVRSVLQYADLVLYDIKHLDPAQHQKYTGVSNQLILANLIKIQREIRIPIWARIPVIPGYNDSVENILSVSKFILDNLDPSVKVHLLPYHRLGESKYERLGRKYQVATHPPEEGDINKLKEIIEDCGLTAISGG
jgi:pyruvate formate lyase activating enzyme